MGEDRVRELLTLLRPPPCEKALIPDKTVRRRSRKDCDLAAWTEHQRMQERGYDAKRRAKKREAGQDCSVSERRQRRLEGVLPDLQTITAQCDSAFDTVLLCIEGMQSATGATELEHHISERLLTSHRPIHHLHETSPSS